jgi:hypothetical protein
MAFSSYYNALYHYQLIPDINDALGWTAYPSVATAATPDTETTSIDQQWLANQDNDGYDYTFIDDLQYVDDLSHHPVMRLLTLRSDHCIIQ